MQRRNSHEARCTQSSANYTSAVSSPDRANRSDDDISVARLFHKMPVLTLKVGTFLNDDFGFHGLELAYKEKVARFDQITFRYGFHE